MHFIRFKNFKLFLKLLTAAAGAGNIKRRMEFSEYFRHRATNIGRDTNRFQTNFICTLYLRQMHFTKNFSTPKSLPLIASSFHLQQFLNRFSN
jgi:hypothetical protein